METTAVVHMTECKPHSTVASARVARFIKDTLGVTLIDTKDVARDRIASCFFPERLIIVNGPMAFCDFLEELAVFVRAAKKVVWVQQDYTIMPPAAISNAESPFRKAFAERNLRPVFWTTCKDNVRTEYDRYINWNQLTYDPRELVAPTISSVTKSATRPRTGCHSASSSHHAPTNVTTTMPPVVWVENTPTSATIASGIRSRCRRQLMISTVVGTASP